LVVAADTDRDCDGHSFLAAANDSFTRVHLVVAEARDGFIDSMMFDIYVRHLLVIPPQMDREQQRLQDTLESVFSG
jgi:hypothetical protein